MSPALLQWQVIPESSSGSDVRFIKYGKLVWLFRV
jgi:hypothetical protein